MLIEAHWARNPAAPCLGEKPCAGQLMTGLPGCGFFCQSATKILYFSANDQNGMSSVSANDGRAEVWTVCLMDRSISVVRYEEKELRIVPVLIPEPVTGIFGG